MNIRKERKTKKWFWDSAGYLKHTAFDLCTSCTDFLYKISQLSRFITSTGTIRLGFLHMNNLLDLVHWVQTTPFGFADLFQILPLIPFSWIFMCYCIHILYCLWPKTHNKCISWIMKSLFKKKKRQYNSLERKCQPLLRKKLATGETLLWFSCCVLIWNTVKKSFFCVLGLKCIQTFHEIFTWHSLSHKVFFAFFKLHGK